MKRSLLVLLALVGGCSCFRASAGFGIGLGASARVGVLDVGCIGGYTHEFGNCYGLVGGMTCGEFGIPALGRREYLRGDDEGVDRDRREGLFPMAFALTESGKTEYYLNRPTEIAVSAYLLFFSFHVGFEPAAIFRAIMGKEEPDGVLEEPKADKDDKPTPLEATKTGELELLLENKTNLVTRRTGRYELMMSPWTAMIASRTDAPDWAALTKRHTSRASGDFARARTSRDPGALEAVIVAAPLSTDVPEAARLMGEIELERGDLDEACFAFELERATTPRDELGDGVRGRIALARAARAHETPPVNEARGGMLRLGELTLASDPQSVWAVTADSEIAWTRTDSLAEGECFRCPAGAVRGLAVFEIGPDPSLNNNASLAATLVALDERGSQRWKVDLPFDGKGPATDHRLYLSSGGRIYALRRSEAVAIDGRTGRLEWYYTRPIRSRPSEMPFDRRPLRPIWNRQPFATLANGVLEWHADASVWPDGEPGRVERLDARTGAPADEAR